MDTRRFTLATALTPVAAYLGLFVGLIDANAVLDCVHRLGILMPSFILR
ncbi:MAG TPA: hypothetical protein VGP27_11755 [Mycobacterium sp.]|jgi:hypothetical protein|nr:hypothetical protein [Mycobacterium sp.]